jgi:hypothetical protein
MSEIRAYILAVVLLATRSAAAQPTTGDDGSQALLAEGDRQRQAHADDQALANFLAAYARAPSPAILLRIADALHDMSRFADEANTDQRFLLDPAAATDDNAAHVKQALAQLDAQLTVLTVRVFPRGSAISIDGGPFVTVGGALVTRVRPGLHLVRIRGASTSELTLNAFPGEAKDVVATLPVTQAPPPAASAPDRVFGWLITGTQYTTDDPAGRARTVHAREDGRPLAAIEPRAEPRGENDGAEPAPPHVDDEDITSGAIGSLRIDGKGRGFAGGLGIAFARGRFEAEILALKSDQVGGYVGLRYRLLAQTWRPYVSAGVPGFVFDHQELQANLSTQTSKQLAVGLRIAAGLEVRITHHLSVLGDIGYEHFVFTDDRFDADVLVPTVGVIGRL